MSLKTIVITVLFFAIAKQSLADFIHEPGVCMNYGECGLNLPVDNSRLRGQMSCLNNTKAPTISPEKDADYFALVQEVCPMLIPKDTEELKICCSEDQLRTLSSQLTASTLVFGRCPSCTENFVTLYCTITCDPDQSMFVNVTKTYQNTGYDLPGVQEQSVYISQEFTEGLHRSCKDVIFPQTNGKAISLLCNGFSGDSCTPQNFLNYLGSINNGVTPVQMNFQQVGNESSGDGMVITNPPGGMGAMDPTFYGCNESPGSGVAPCSCTDCEPSCPAPPPLKEPIPPFKIGSADGVSVIMLIIFLAITLVFLSYVVFTCRSNRKVSSTDDSFNSSLEGSEKLDIIGKYSTSTSSSNSIYDDAVQPLVDYASISKFQRLGKISQSYITKGFRWWGTLVARKPLWILIPTVLVVVGLSIGTRFVILTTDPVELWTAEQSRVRLEKGYYDSHFGAFFRTEMVIMTLKPQYQSNGSKYTSFNNVKYNFSEILDKKYLLDTLELQNKLRYMNVSYEDGGKTKYGTLNDICFKPLEPDNNNCTITAIMNYWQNDPNVLNETTVYYNEIEEETFNVDYRDHFLYCMQSPAAIQDTTPLTQSCLGDFGGPIFPFLILGGQEEKEAYNEAQALILTFVVNNFAKDDERTKLVKAWEQAFLAIMADYESEYFEFTYFSERSPEDELTRSSQTDIVVFVASYVVIFAYITIALGTYTSCRRIPVDSKVSLGVVGILVILGSVFASVGFFGYIGYATSLIVIEVVPFLVLAIGADNVFILTLEYQRDERKPDEPLPEQIGRVFGEVAPSMLLCSLTECVTFFLGALSGMPAVQQFALAAALAILFDFLLQITAFLAVLSLDARRQEQNRMDCCCCFRTEGADEPNKSYLQIFFHEYYAPFLMNDVVRVIVMIGFAGLCCWCIVLTNNMTVGLDQDLSVPKDSYVLKYFDDMEEYLDVGVPVYFVTKNPYNFSNPDAGKFICGSSGCDTYSLTQQITFASQRPEYWKIETPAASWYDDYIDWLLPQGVNNQQSCCRYQNSNPDDFCPATQDFPRCTSCLETANYTSKDFMEFLPWFLIDNPGLECNKGGHSAYGNALTISTNYSSEGQDVVEASYFMAYHSVCIKSVDCTENLVKARELADNITATLKAANTDENGFITGNEDDFEVFPYCLYYVYYEQYLTIVDDTLFLVGICLIPAFAFSFILLGFDWYSGIVTVVTIVMIVVDTAGLSSLWGVHLNAVSLINLVQAIGLSVEFISHVVQTFAKNTNASRKERVIDAMATMGPAVFAGVALTNLPGIIVLNWATAQLIQIFFFRMCLIITLLGMAHGLVFLPVFLSYFGPPVNKAILYEKQKAQRESKSDDGISNEAYKIDAEMHKF